MLERKLAISQAYSDALKQTHEKSRQGDSHVETSTESTSAASSADYAQVSVLNDHYNKLFGKCMHQNGASALVVMR